MSECMFYRNNCCFFSGVSKQTFSRRFNKAVLKQRKTCPNATPFPNTINKNLCVTAACNLINSSLALRYSIKYKFLAKVHMYGLVFWNVTSCSLVYADDNVRHNHVSQAVTVSKLPGDINKLLNIDCGIRRAILVKYSEMPTWCNEVILLMYS